MTRKKTIAISIAATLLLSVVVAMFIISNPFKITDPSDPRFNPDKFSFSDYEKPGELQNAYKILFPPGTPKEFVDRVLVGAGKAKIGTKPLMEPNVWGYRRPSNSWKGGPKDAFLYNQEDKLLNISIGGNYEIYDDQPKFIKQ